MNKMNFFISENSKSKLAWIFTPYIFLNSHVRSQSFFSWIELHFACLLASTISKYFITLLTFPKYAKRKNKHLKSIKEEECVFSISLSIFSAKIMNHITLNILANIN